MGNELKKIFETVEEKAGFKGRVTLSSRCGIPSDKAATMADDAEVLAKVKAIADEILAEHESRTQR